jgi:hypothetical protein
MGLFGERKPKLKDFDNPKLDIISQEQFLKRMQEIDSQQYLMCLSSEYRQKLKQEWSTQYNTQPHLVRARLAEQQRNRALEQQRLAKWRKESAEREHAEKYPFAKTIKTK